MTNLTALPPRTEQLVLVYGRPGTDETCIRCDTSELPHVAVGERDAGRYCDDCTTCMAPAELADLATALDLLDTALTLADPDRLPTLLTAAREITAHVLDQHAGAEP